ncbi:hypothetical protein Tco_0486407 [Tanacetum coccineum]
MERCIYTYKGQMGLGLMDLSMGLSLTTKISSAGSKFVTFKSFKIFTTHINSHVAAAIDLYYASAEDLDKVACFLLFYETMQPLKNTQYPETNLLVTGHLAQSDSAYTFKDICSDVILIRPCPIAFTLTLNLP